MSWLFKLTLATLNNQSQGLALHTQPRDVGAEWVGWPHVLLACDSLQVADAGPHLTAQNFRKPDRHAFEPVSCKLHVSCVPTTRVALENEALQLPVPECGLHQCYSASLTFLVQHKHVQIPAP